MPHIPAYYERARQGKKPDVLGEEGALFRNGAFWIKRWTNAHEQGFGVPNRHQESSIVPPHWTKFQYWQGKLISTFVPEHSIDIAAGYDPRIYVAADGSRAFDVSRGKPVTISRNVPIEGEMPQQYVERVHGLYRRTSSQFDNIRQSPEVDMNVREAYDTDWDRTEDQLLRMIAAEEFRWFQGDQGDLRDAQTLESFFRNLENRIQNINPRSPILKLLRIGVVPIHPAFNFIPREPAQTTTRPDGTFLEMRVMHFQRMQLAIHQLPEREQRKAQRIFNRFAIYNDMCAAYNQLMLGLLTTGKGGEINTRTYTLFYQLLERVAEYGRKGDLQQFHIANYEVSRYIQDAIRAARSMNQVHEAAELCLNSRWEFQRRR